MQEFTGNTIFFLGQNNHLHILGYKKPCKIPKNQAGFQKKALR